MTGVDAQEIKRSIEELKVSAKTTYGNCEKLVILEKALKYMDDGGRRLADAHDEDAHRVTLQEAGAWVNRMKNADGSVGAHWTMEQTEQFRTQRGIDLSSIPS